MRPLKKIAVTAGLLAVLLTGFLPAQAVPVIRLDADKLAWHRLSYTAKKALATLTTEIQWQNLPAETVNKLLIPVPRGVAVQSAGSRLLSIEGRSVVKPLWGATDVLKTQAWYDPGSGDVLQRIRWRQGGEQWEKTYRFTNEGVFRLRKMPGATDEIDEAPARWSGIEKSFYPYPPGGTECPHVLEPLALMFFVSALDAQSANATPSLCVFNKKQLHQVQIRKAGLKRLAVDYTRKLKEGEARRQGYIEAVRYSIQTRSLAGNAMAPEPFSFLGLEGDVDIFIEPLSRIPVQVSGVIPPMGSVTIHLREVH